VADARPVHFDADIIDFRIRRSHLREALAIAETDFDTARRVTSEDLGKINIDVRIKSVNRPIVVQGILLARGQPPLAANETLDFTRKKNIGGKHQMRR